MSTILEQAGYIVDVAEDGLVALTQIQHSIPDLVITDLRMPNMNGFELLSVIRTKFSELPTIAISGEFLKVDAHHPLADAFFQKGNYELPDLLGKISHLLATPRKSAMESRSSAPLWVPTGDAPPMVTCTNCLCSFPFTHSNGGNTLRETNCLSCGMQLAIRPDAIGLGATAD